MFIASSIALLTLGSTAFGIAYPGPAPTQAGDAFEANLNGRSPKPTGRPRSLPELFRRQADDGVCGYLQGDSGMHDGSDCSIAH